MTDDRRQSLQRRFDGAYSFWSVAHAVVSLALVIVAEIEALRAVALVALAAWVGGALGVLFAFGKSIHPDGAGPALPNALTTTRVLTAVFLILAVAAGKVHPALASIMRSAGGWILASALLLVEVTDFFDGRVARKRKAGAFGAVWDMENDVVYALALSLLLRHVHGVAVFVLAIGSMRFLYVLFLRYETDPVVVPRVYKLYAKTTAAIIAVTLSLAVIPVLSHRIRTVGLAIVLAMQLVSFGWDLALQRRAGSG